MSAPVQTPVITRSDRDAASKAFDVAFRGDTAGIDDAMAGLFASHTADALAKAQSLADALAYLIPDCDGIGMRSPMLENARAALTDWNAK